MIVPLQNRDENCFDGTFKYKEVSSLTEKHDSLKK